MAKFTTEQIRNVCFLGHGGSGKTTLNEAMLYLTKNIDRMGKTLDGNSTSDYDTEEIKRGFSIYTTLTNVEWQGTKINALDAPGFLDFVGEVLAALRVADTAIITVDAKSGVEVGTELSWDNVVESGKAKAFFVNKSDDPDANFAKTLDELIERFGASVCPVVVPVAPGKFVNLASLKEYSYDKDGKCTEKDADPASVEEYTEKFFEAIASVDEELMEKYFSGEEISHEEATKALKTGIASGDITPVYSGSALKLWGVDVLMSGIASTFPAPNAASTVELEDGEEMELSESGAPTLFVYKTASDQFGRTTYFKVVSGELTNAMTLRNVETGASEKFAHFYVVKGKKQTEVDVLCCGDIGTISKLTNTNTNDTLTLLSDDVKAKKIAFPEPFLTMAVLPKVKGEEDKVAQGILRMVDSDKTLRFENDPETHQLLLSGIGDMQIDIVISKLKAKNGPSVDLEAPRIAYRETIRKRVQCEGKHKKQSGGHGQYGHVKMTFAPGEEEGLTFTTSVVGGSVPKNYFPAVEKGLLEAMKKGVLAGYPVVGLAADLFDGSYHDVDSNELSFKMAASLAYKAGLPNAAPVLLEPIGELKVCIPDSFAGSVMGDINGKRRGSVLGSSATPGKLGYTTIDAEVPKAEMSDYAISLRAMTQGKGSFTFYFTRYQEVPGNIAQKVIAEAKERATEEDK